MSLKYHPDKPNGDEEKFKEINEAYQTLSNDEKRRQYDNKNSNNYFNRNNRGGFNHSMYSSGGGFNGDPMNDLFSSMFNHGNFPFHFSENILYFMKFAFGVSAQHLSFFNYYRVNFNTLFACYLNDVG